MRPESRSPGAGSSRKRLRHAAIGLVLGALAVDTAQPAAAEDVIRFGASLSLTGSMATEGRLVRDGYDFYVKLANERGGIDVGGVPHRVEMVYYDDESDAQRATTLVERLIIEDEVDSSSDLTAVG
jgi:ABC-type branched-subunit amino acid transport system substrate-binding protein